MGKKRSVDWLSEMVGAFINDAWRTRVIRYMGR